MLDLHLKKTEQELKRMCWLCVAGLVVEAAGVASVRKHQELPLRWTEPVPAGSKADLPVAKAEPISSVHGTHVITGLRSSKNCCAAAVRKE